jgi:hypothetical protein
MFASPVGADDDDGDTADEVTDVTTRELDAATAATDVEEVAGAVKPGAALPLPATDDGGKTELPLVAAVA